MNPALLQKGSNSFRTDSEIKDHEGDLLPTCLIAEMLRILNIFSVQL